MNVRKKKCYKGVNISNRKEKHIGENYIKRKENMYMYMFNVHKRQKGLHKQKIEQWERKNIKKNLVKEESGRK